MCLLCRTLIVGDIGARPDNDRVEEVMLGDGEIQVGRFNRV
jgi:hypothetical protein